MKNLGFGMMRLPVISGPTDFDYKQLNEMTDAFLEAGFTYFDTSFVYHNGKSEEAVRKALVERHPRDSYTVATKFPTFMEIPEEKIEETFRSQLDHLGVEYVDYYLLHNIQNVYYDGYDGKGGIVKTTHLFDHAKKWKESGKIRHLGISFHSSARLLDRVLTEHPEIEIVQIQFNYVDYEDASVESRKVYEVCEKHGKPVVVMEPVKGGSLVNLPADADKILRELDGGSNASYAIRFAASFPNMAMVLSGMSDMEQMEDNISAMKNFEPLSDTEMEAVRKVCDIFKGLNLIPCTSCRYCIEESQCPKGIRIPDMFSSLNAHEAFHNWNTGYYYNNIITGGGHGKASECIKCGKCEKVCPQHLPIRELLEDVARTFE